jgi:hypothetical protein
MSNIDRKLIGVEKLFNEVLPTIYPHITNIKISKNDTDGYRYPDYDLIIDTDLPNTITKDDYWDNEFWSTKNFERTANRYHLFDYHYMNDVIMPELLEYFSIKDAEFDRRVKIYNVDKELIITTE